MVGFIIKYIYIYIYIYEGILVLKYITGSGRVGSGQELAGFLLKPGPVPIRVGSGRVPAG